MTCEIGTDVVHAAALLAAGKLVAFPTETVYGLGADALNTSAVAAVFAAKERPHFDPLIVHLAETSAAAELTTSFPPAARLLAERFWPGPLTLVLPKADDVPDLVTAGLPTVALRVPRHPVARSLIERTARPIAAPSANQFGQVSPTTAAHVASQLGERIDYILDGGPCDVGVESTVLSLAGERPTLLRPGGVSLEDLEAVLGPVDVFKPEAGNGNRPQSSPGLLERHYAPRTSLRLIEELPSADVRAGLGLLSLGPVEGSQQFGAVEILSATHDLTEAAARFYAALRRLDESGVSEIVARRFPQEGLGRALNDRLLRAASIPCRAGGQPIF